MKLILPAGIGDVEWVIARLWSVLDEIESVGIIDGAPRRTVPYVEALGLKGYYSEIDQYQLLLTFEHAQRIDWKSEPTWERIKSLGTDYVLLEANQHLEHGRPLAEWLPDLPEPQYHHDYIISDEDHYRAAEVTVKAICGDARSKGHPMEDGPVVGISCASYKGADAWDTWRREQWVDFLKRVMAIGWRPLMVGGGWDDLTYSVACDLDLPYTVGKTSVPQMIEQMALLDSYIGFSSGMNVIRCVHNKPAMALWPCNPRCDQKELSTAWAPPKMLEDERYVAMSWLPVDDVWPVAKAFLRRCEREIVKSNGKGAEDAVHDEGT
jgi:hypothetical protein